MANWAKIGKWTAILAPIAIVGGWWYIKTQKDKALKTGEEQKKTPPNKVQPSTTNKFPLKEGVKDNDYVKSLQLALGVASDGWFGKHTYDALVSQIGVEQVDSLEDLNAIIQQIKDQNDSVNAVNVRQTYADQIINKYISGSPSPTQVALGTANVYSDIKFIKDGVIKEVVSSVDGIHTQNNYVETEDSRYINFKKGETLPLEGIHLSSNNGYIIIDIENGYPHAGIWKAYPQQIDLV